MHVDGQEEGAPNGRMWPVRRRLRLRLRLRLQPIHTMSSGHCRQRVCNSDSPDSLQYLTYLHYHTYYHRQRNLNDKARTWNILPTAGHYFVHGMNGRDGFLFLFTFLFKASRLFRFAKEI